MRIKHLFASVGIVLALGFLIVGAILGFFWWQHSQPVTLPQPSGRYPVGRMQFDWRDSQRVDPLAPAAGVRRELTVWIWYPAQPGTGKGTADYLPAPLREALDRHAGAILRNFLTHDLTRVHAHAIRDAAVARGEAAYPVVLLKPGIGALALDYTSFAEDLASHGYVVVASDSPYSTAVVVYEDGRIVTRTRAGHPVDEGLPPPPREAIENVLRVWVADEHFLADQLERMNAAAAGPFSGRLNLATVGAFGHSFGGATALQFCFEDVRCRAAIDVDGIPFGDVARGVAVHKPFLFLLSDHSADRAPEDAQTRAAIDAMRKRLPNQPNYVVLAGTRHFNLSDQALTKNTRVARAVGMLGPTDERRALAGASRWIDSFFDVYLKGKPPNEPNLLP